MGHNYFMELFARVAHLLKSSIWYFDRHLHHQVVPSVKINNAKICISESYPYKYICRILSCSSAVLTAKTKNCIQIMHFWFDEQFLKLNKILKLKIKGTFGALFRYSVGQNDTSPKYFWSLCFKTQECNWELK